MRILITVICICLMLPAAFPSPVLAEESVIKRYNYNLYWSGIKAGEAVLEYVDTPLGFRIKVRAMSSKFISYFYEVDDRAESILYPDGYPRDYILKIREGRHRKYKVTKFAKISEGTPQKILFHDILNKEKEEYTLDIPAYGPLSGFYAMTQILMEVGRTEYIKIFDTKKIFDAEIKVLGKEKVSVPAGEFNTIKVNPILKTEGIFLRKGKMYIWLTDDEKKVPVQFSSKVTIGSFVAKLVEEH